MTLQLSSDNKVISLIEFRKSRELEAKKIAKRIKALERVLERRRRSNSQEYNHYFYTLVDLFMREHYPDYAWRFDVWLKKIEKEKNDNA